MRKRWWQSKTIWFNAAVAAGVALESNLNILQGHIAPGLYVALASVVAGGNVALRLITTQPIGKPDASR